MKVDKNKGKSDVQMMAQIMNDNIHNVPNHKHE